MMETISLALALPGGDTSGLAEVVEGHPLLHLCGVARTPEDLERLLRRFSPDMLLISRQMVLEVDGETLERWREERLGLFPALLVTGDGLPAGEADLPDLLRVPFAFCGVVDAGDANAEKLYLQVRERVDLFRSHLKADRDTHPGGGPASTGPVILCGAKGGVGNTLLACALAASQARLERRVLLVDLDRERSQLSMLKPEGVNKSLVDLLPLAEDLSWEMARVSMYRHPAGFHLLPFGNHARKGMDRPLRLPRPFFRNLDFLFDVVIVDLPGHLAQEFLPSLLPWRNLVVVTQAEAMSARCARLLGQVVRGFGVDPSGLRLAINRYGRHAALQPHEISRAAGIRDVFLLPEDPRSGLDFAELGRLPLPDSPLGKAVAGLNAFLEGEDSSPASTSPSRLLRPGRKARPSRLPRLSGR